jgi:ferric-dicitrate binding protein FerR (iron transport regulator)
MRKDRDNRKITQEAADWIRRVESGDSGCKEAFTEWLERDEERCQAVREIMRISRAMRTLSPAERSTIAAAVKARPCNVVRVRRY